MASMDMDMGWIRGLIAVTTMATFLGICWWAYRPGNRARFEEDALLAFEDEEQARVRRGKGGGVER